MTYFEQALSAPELHIKRLRQIERVLVDDRLSVKCSHHAIEAEIIWEERHYILSLPFYRESIRHIEELNEIAYDRSIGPLLHHRIFYDELTLVDSIGHNHSFDVVLQELPEGTIFSKAVDMFKGEELRQAIVKMKDRLDNIGFLHGNLRPYNVIICNSGIARPLRYWYAKWERSSNNDISKLVEALDAASYLPDEYKQSMILGDDVAEYNTPKFHEGIKRLCRGGRYGFIDYEGNQVTPYIYSWASDFYEGRAVVSNNNKYGAIDNQGKKVIPVIYHTLEFDIKTGLFTATMKPYHYIIDYNGKIIRRTKIEEETESYVLIEESVAPTRK